jgi:RNA polymerase sigma factor for flagellar operon FliA
MESEEQNKEVATEADATPLSEARAYEETLRDLTTEEIWELYHQKAKETGPRSKEIEPYRNSLMERHLPLVKYIAERLLQTLPKSIELDDLISAGLFGLMDAIRGFDPERGIKFKTYCTTRIRGSILDQLRSQDWVPRLVRLKASKIDKALNRLTAEYGREPTHSELAESMEMEPDELTREMDAASARSMYSLSEKWEDNDDEGSGEKIEVLEDHQATDPIQELNQNDLLAYMTRSLTPKERFIIEQYYRAGHTMREIGEMLNLTESRVCQIHSNVMDRLKALLGQKSGSLLM